MKAEQLKIVVDKHKKYIDIPSRSALQEMIFVTESLLEEEIKHQEESHPGSAAAARMAREILRELYNTVDNMDTAELVKLNIWKYPQLFTVLFWDV